MSRARPTVMLWLALLTTACGGVSHTLRKDLPAPQTLAILPFAGPADLDAREATRALIQSRLQARGFQVAESAWTDRVLSQHGWLRDPLPFDPSQVPAADLVAALGVDGVVIGTGFAERSFNFYILRRHAFGGALALRLFDGTTWWSADHTASTLGGFLLTSGQVFNELRAQGDHRTPMATFALADEFVSDVAATVPSPPERPRADDELALAEVTLRRTAQSDGTERCVVEASAKRGSNLCCEFGKQIRGVPMVELPDQPGRYRGSHDLPTGAPIETVVVRARGAFGREAQIEVRQ